MTAAAVALLIHNLDFAALGSSLRGIDTGWWPFLILLTVGSWMLKCWRMQSLFPREQAVTLRACSIALGIGVIGNLVFPLRAGDVLRCAVLRQLAERTSVEGILGTFALEKLLESMAIAAILLYWAGLVALPAEVHVVAGRLAAASATAVALGVAAWILFDHVDTLLSRVGNIHGWPGRAAARARTFFQELRRCLNWRRMTVATLQTALLRLVDAATFLVLALAVGMQVDLSQAFLVMAVIAVATALPAAPGYLGTYEAGGVIALGLIGVAKPAALAYAITTHLWFIATWIVFGVIAVFSLPLPMRSRLFAGNP